MNVYINIYSGLLPKWHPLSFSFSFCQGFSPSKGFSFGISGLLLIGPVLSSKRPATNLLTHDEEAFTIQRIQSLHHQADFDHRDQRLRLYSLLHWRFVCLQARWHQVPNLAIIELHSDLYR